MGGCVRPIRSVTTTEISAMPPSMITPATPLHANVWLVAGSFGLLHGFGFAGALSQVGLPANDIPLALLFFNLGVEAGQIAFVVVTLGVIAPLRRMRLPEWSPLLAPYAIGSVAMFWVMARIAAIW